MNEDTIIITRKTGIEMAQDSTKAPNEGALKTHPRASMPDHSIGAPVSSNFVKSKTSKMTNNLTQSIPRKKDEPMLIHPKTGKFKFELSDQSFTVQILDYITKGRKLRTSVYKTFDLALVKFTQHGKDDDSKIILPLEEYMQLCNLKDRKTAKKQLLEDLDTLFGMSIDYTEGKRNISRAQVIDSFDGRRGGVWFRFGVDLRKSFQNANIMYYPKSLFAINPRLNPHSYYLVRKITTHKNMNFNKNNENIIAVSSLLKNAPLLPTYDEVMAGARQVNKRIIEPFVRDLSAVPDTFTWRFYKDGISEEPTVTMIEQLTYDEFITYSIMIEWLDHPRDQQRNDKLQANHAKS